MTKIRPLLNLVQVLPVGNVHRRVLLAALSINPVQSLWDALTMDSMRPVLKGLSSTKAIIQATVAGIPRLAALMKQAGWKVDVHTDLSSNKQEAHGTHGLHSAVVDVGGRGVLFITIEGPEITLDRKNVMKPSAPQQAILDVARRNGGVASLNDVLTVLGLAYINKPGSWKKMVDPLVKGGFLVETAPNLWRLTGK